MAEVKQITFSYQEVAQALLKHHGIHKGIWGVYVRFGLKATNIGSSGSDLLPAAIVPIVEIGLQTFERESNLAVDASVVNPAVNKTQSHKPRAKKTA